MEQVPGKQGDMVLTTGELSKLPPAVQALVDPAQALPAGVRFFEERQTVVESLKTLFLGVGLGVVGIALVFPGVLISLYVAIVGVVFVLGGAVMVNSFLNCIKALRAQQAGRQTRYGVFLTGDDLLIRDELSYTVIPRSSYHDLQGSTLYYRVEHETKSLTLPQTLVRADGAGLLASVRAWAKGN